MNLSLELRAAGGNSLQSVVAQFEAAQRDPDSPIRAIHHQPAADGVFADMPEAVDPRLRTALAKRGITPLYCHQADAFEQVTAGKNTVIVTPTASGKTLCYN